MSQFGTIHDMPLFPKIFQKNFLGRGSLKIFLEKILMETRGMLGIAANCGLALDTFFSPFKKMVLISSKKEKAGRVSKIIFGRRKFFLKLGGFSFFVY